MLHHPAVLSVEMHFNTAAADAGNELRPCIIRRFVAAAADTPKQRQAVAARLAKTDAEVADDILPLASFFEDDVVRTLGVPVVDECHHQHQALHLRCAFEWRPTPFPRLAAFDVVGTGLETYVGEGPFAGNRQ